MVDARQSKSHVPNTDCASIEPFLPFTRGKRKVRSGTVFKVYAFVTGFKVAVFIARFHGNFSTDKQ